MSSVHLRGSSCTTSSASGDPPSEPLRFQTSASMTSATPLPAGSPWRAWTSTRCSEPAGGRRKPWSSVTPPSARTTSEPLWNAWPFPGTQLAPKPALKEPARHRRMEKCLENLARLEGFEPPTLGLEERLPKPGLLLRQQHGRHFFRACCLAGGRVGPPVGPRGHNIGHNRVRSDRGHRLLPREA